MTRRTSKIELPNPQKIVEETEDRLTRRTEEIAKRLAPIESGRLRADIQRQGGSVFNTVEYAPFVHDGTAERAPQPYLRQAAKRALDEESRQ
jgi:hypothetical protein